MRHAVIVSFVILVVPVIAFSATLKVPGNYPTIQQAIDAAVNGDTVLVAPGTYVENIDFKGKAITVTSSAGAGMTVIDGNQKGSVVLFQSGEGMDSVLDGFTVTHGSGTFVPSWGYCGGGIYCMNASPTITNNVVVGNVVSYIGGGIYCFQSKPIITNNILIGNSALSGGGISCWSSFPVVTNNTLCKNSATNGGGLWCSYFSQPQITNTIFWSNNGSKGPHIWIGNLSIVFICYSDMVGGKGKVHIESGTLNWGSGMIDADPLFVNSDNDDFHLTYPSPCKDTGDNSAVTALHDFEGDPRIAYGTVDMGADEFSTHLYWTGDATPGGSAALKFVGLPGTSPVQLWLGSGVMDPPLPTKYGDWYLQFPLLVQLVLGSIPVPDGVYILPFTFPPDTPTPLSLPFQAGIGTELSNLCVLEVE